MNRYRLGFYCPGVGNGGPWRYVHSLLAGLDPAEFDVTVFCDLPGEYEPRPWVNVVRLSGDPAPDGRMNSDDSTRNTPRRLGVSRWVPKTAKLWAGFGRETRRLARFLRLHPMDIFHTQNTGCEESAVAARLAGVRRVVGTFHVNSAIDIHGLRSGPGHRTLEVVSNRCLDAAIAVSHATKRDWVQRSRIPANRVVTIHNGIDPEKFRRRKSREAARRELGLPADGLIVGGLGRLDEIKGYTDLLTAAVRMRAEYPNLVVVLAGSGPLQEQLERQAVQLTLGGVVRFLGFRSDVQLVLDALDVFAMPSLNEALPYGLLEAMASELPAVGSAVGGIPEVIVEGVTGFLVPPRDPNRLAERLEVLLRDADLRARFGTAARERVARHFREDDMVRKTIELYRSAR